MGCALWREHGRLGFSAAPEPRRPGQVGEPPAARGGAALRGHCADRCARSRPQPQRGGCAGHFAPRGCGCGCGGCDGCKGQEGARPRVQLPALPSVHAAVRAAVLSLRPRSRCALRCRAPALPARSRSAPLRPSLSARPTRSCTRHSRARTSGAPPQARAPRRARRSRSRRRPLRPRPPPPLRGPRARPASASSCAQASPLRAAAQPGTDRQCGLARDQSEPCLPGGQARRLKERRLRRRSHGGSSAVVCARVPRRPRGPGATSATATAHHS